jgi:hypothetical protein
MATGASLSVASVLASLLVLESVELPQELIHIRLQKASRASVKFQDLNMFERFIA